MNKDYLLSLLHSLYRDDIWVQELFHAVGIELDNLAQLVDELAAQNFFDSVTEEGLKEYEKQLGINVPKGQSFETRRAVVEAKWKSGGKTDIQQIQAVADSWRNGVVDVGFENGAVKLTFVGEYGVPSDMDSLLSAVSNIKPAHLALVYVLKYLLIRDIHDTMTIAELETMTLNKFAFGGEN